MRFKIVFDQDKNLVLYDDIGVIRFDRFCFVRSPLSELATDV